MTPSGWLSLAPHSVSIRRASTPPSAARPGFSRAPSKRYEQSEANIFAHAHAEGGSVTEVIDHILARAARLYAEHDGVAGCLVLEGTRNSADSEARSLTAKAKRANRDAIRDFIATEYPARADDLAAFVTIAMAGMSAAARDGADEATLETFAQNATRAFRRELGLG